MRSTAATLAAFAGAAACCSALAADVPPPTTGPVTTATPPGLTPVDAMRSDVGPVVTSTRVIQPDLRIPLNFDEVYRVRDPAGAGSASRHWKPRDQFARISGGVAAVFPRSQYTPTEIDRGVFGIKVDVPAGTVFYLGGVPAPAPGSERQARPAALVAPTGPIDLSVTQQPITNMVRAISPSQPESDQTTVLPALARTEPRTIAAPPLANGRSPHAEPLLVSVMNDEGFRRTRLRELLTQAASAPRDDATVATPADDAARPNTAAVPER